MANLGLVFHFGWALADVALAHQSASGDGAAAPLATDLAHVAHAAPQLPSQQPLSPHVPVDRLVADGLAPLEPPSPCYLFRAPVPL